MGRQKGFVTAIILIMSAMAITIAVFVYLQKYPRTSRQTILNEEQVTTRDGFGCQFGKMPAEMYLDIYVVQPGDTLLSIANNQLGSTSRVDEIINLNKNRGGKYHSLYSSNVIEEGWELYLPVKSLPPNSGELVAQMGKVSIDTQSTFAGRMLVVTQPQYFPTGQPTSFTGDSVFFGTDDFKVGDCVLIIRDEGTDNDILLAINKGPGTLRDFDVTFTLNEVVFPTEDAKCEYKFLSADVVMRKYKVKIGDSLASIAAAELGDTDRADEIKEANKDRYSSLKSENFIEVGWGLLLPPKWSKRTSGYLTGFAGTLLREEESSFVVSKDLRNPAHSRFSKNDQIMRFGKEDFERGDCVVILNARGSSLAISTQDVDYIELFKYGKNQ